MGVGDSSTHSYTQRSKVSGQIHSPVIFAFTHEQVVWVGMLWTEPSLDLTGNQTKQKKGLFQKVSYTTNMYTKSLFLAQQPPVGQDLLIHEVSRSHTMIHHSRHESTGGVKSSSQRPLPDNTQHSRQTSMPLVGFEPTISAGEWLQTYTLDCPATGAGIQKQ